NRRLRAGLQSASDDSYANVGQAVDVCVDDVAFDDRTHILRRSGINDVAGREIECLGELADLLGHRPDHLVQIGVLLDLSIDLEPDRAVLPMSDFSGWSQRSERRGMTE